MTTTAVPSKLPEDFALNIDNLDKFSNSTSPTFTDRLGVVKKTITGVLAEYPNASGNAADAAVSAGDAQTQANIAMVQAGISTAQAVLAATAKTVAEAARDAAQLSSSTWPTTAAALGNGVAGYASLVAGSGGANGTFALAFSGGTQKLAPVGYFVVAGGFVVQVAITYPGYYSAGAPTLSFAASAGLTGASATAVMAINVASGRYFSTPSADSNEYLILWLNSAGVAVEQKRYQSPTVGVEGVYNLVNPAATVLIGGLNSAGAWNPSSAYNSIAIRVDAGDALVLLNTVEIYAGGSQYNASFFSALPPSAGTFISVAPGTLVTNLTGNKYIAPTVPANAKYVVVNVKFNSEVISWFAAKDTAYSTSPSFIPGLARINDVPVLDRAGRKSVAVAFADTEGDENLYTAVNSLIDRYVTGAWTIGASSAAQGWRVAVVPVIEGQTYATYFGPTFQDVYWSFGLYATGPLQANALTSTSKIVYGATLDTQVKTFTVPTGQGITHAFVNAKASIEDYTATMIVQMGSTVPVRPLAYVPALKKVDNKPVKDVYARTKIVELTQLTYGDTRFVGQKVYYFGDSITEGTQGGYVKYITDILQCVPTNYGSSGARTGRLVARATDQLNRQEVGGAATNPDYTGVVAVTIQIGTNDITSPGTIGSLADIPAQSIIDLPFTPSGGSLTSTPAQYWALFPSTFYGNLGLVIEYIKYRNSATLIYLISPPHQYGADMTVIRTALQALAKHYSVRFIDAQDEAGLEKKQLLKYSYDGTHLNTLGNALWGKYIGYRMVNS